MSAESGTSFGRGRWLGGCALLLALLLGGCESLRFYGQAARGQLGLLLAREPVSELLAQPDLDPSLREQLQRSQQLLDYLSEQIGLEVGDRYRSYVALERDAVLYNLVATARFSVEAHQWCYPIAGCAPYRGYFRAGGADRAARRFRDRGFTTFIGRVPAYSTLGWFDDPLLSTFIYWSEARLLNLLAHELAHSRLWLKGDAPFNEAFASFVGAQAVRDYYGGAQAPEYRVLQAREVAWRRLVALLLELRARLAALYDEPLSDEEKIVGREMLYEAFQACYAEHHEDLGAGRFDRYVQTVNDAALAGLATYENDQPLFARLFVEQNSRWDGFFAQLEALNALGAEARTSWITALRERVSAHEQITHGADHESTDDVQCRALARHAVDGNPP